MPLVPPSTRWASLDDWDYDGLKERLQSALASISKDALLKHARELMGQEMTMSEPFSAGQHWVCFEMIGKRDGKLVIARVRLPHKSSDLAEAYAIECEIATMSFVRARLPKVRLPAVYAYETPGSERTSTTGAPYMLLEGFYGNTLQDGAADFFSLPDAIQHHIITQWTRVQAELATFAWPRIGSISQLGSGEPVIGPLASASIDQLQNAGPFPTALDYFTELSEALRKTLTTQSSAGSSCEYCRLGTLVFDRILSHTKLFNEDKPETLFQLSHMDLGFQNMLIDDDFNIVAVIDWEYAQSAPWQTYHYPMPFPLREPDQEIQDILKDPSHLAHRNVERQNKARMMYKDGFQVAEDELEKQGKVFQRRISDVLDSPASRVFACFSTLGDLHGEGDKALVHAMLQLAFGMDSERAEEYLKSL